jgi:hypothetical protein
MGVETTGDLTPCLREDKFLPVLVLLVKRVRVSVCQARLEPGREILSSPARRIRRRTVGAAEKRRGRDSICPLYANS